MESNKQITGVVRTWNVTRGYGIISVSITEQFFLHSRAVVEAPKGMNDPTGCTVYFDVAPALNNGKLSRAINARIIAPVAPGSQTLGGAR
jgi:cold shock CspA family protein